MIYLNKMYIYKECRFNWKHEGEKLEWKMIKDKIKNETCHPKKTDQRNRIDKTEWGRVDCYPPALGQKLIDKPLLCLN